METKLRKILGVTADQVLAGLDHIGVYITDPERRILYWNEAAEKITGFSSQEVIGSNCYDNVLCHGDRHGRPLCSSHLCPLNQCMTSGKKIQPGGIVFLQDRNRERIPVRVSISPIHDQDGNLLGGIEFFRDARAEHSELAFAHSIQNSLIPDPRKFADQLDIGLHTISADYIGGDFVVIFPGMGETIAGVIGDVSGHGLPAALFTTFIRGNLSCCEGQVKSPTDLLYHLAHCFNRMDFPMSFYTAQAFLYDPAERTIRVSNGGHPPPILLDRYGKIVEHGISGGDVIGIHETPVFRETTLSLEERTMLMFTDGITEARNHDNSLFGIAPLLSGIRNNLQLPVAESARITLDWLFRQADRLDPGDDMTLLMLRTPEHQAGPVRQAVPERISAEQFRGL